MQLSMVRGTRLLQCPPCAMTGKETMVTAWWKEHFEDLINGSSEGAPSNRITIMDDGQAVDKVDKVRKATTIYNRYPRGGSSGDVGNDPLKTHSLSSLPSRYAR